ncbi:MAG: ABC transporter ATPase [Weeksellaceae bacterium]|nr:ABC transporter ATPase [Weeksellaceae bacterium]
MMEHQKHFAGMPAESRLWTFMADKVLKQEDLDVIHQRAKQFLMQWNAHGDAVQGEYAVLYNQFLVMVVDEKQTAVSGCSVDSMVRFVQELGSELQVDFTNRMLIAYLQHDRMEIRPLPQFKQQVRSGDIDAETLVFNPSVVTLQEWRDNWLVHLPQSWAGSLLPN